MRTGARSSLHFDGQGWTQVPSGTTGDLDRVVAVSPTEAWAIGTGWDGLMSW